MAIYYLNLKIGKQKSKNHYEYITRKGAYKNYNKGEDFIYTESKNLPTWSKDAKDYWKAVSELESGTQYREFEVALPKEFTNEQNIKLVQDFCKNTFSNNYTYSFAVHKNIGELSGEENPHSHIMFSERIIDRDRKKEPTKEEYFKQRRKEKDTGEYKNGYIKDRAINGAKRKEWLEEKRKLWADIQNNHLKENGYLKKVSHLSLKEQGIERLPQKHLGKKVVQMTKKGIETDTYKNYQEIKTKNKKIRYIENQETKLTNIQNKIKKQETLLLEKQKEFKIVKEQIEKLPSRYYLESQIRELEYYQKSYKDSITLGEQYLKEYRHLKKDIAKYEKENITATRILNKIVKTKDHEQYIKNKHELESIKSDEFFEEYALEGGRKEYIEKYKETKERLIDLKQANNNIFNKYHVLATQREEIQKEINDIEKEKLNQVRKVEEIIYEDNLKNAYEKQGIDILNEKGEIDKTKIPKIEPIEEIDIQKIFNPYKEIEDMIQEMQPVIQKKRNRDYDLER